MQVSVEVLDGLERRMTVQLPAKRVDGEVQKRLNDLSRRIRIDGFRPGKVPMKVVKKRYGEQVRAEVVTELLRSSYTEALQQEKLQPAGSPSIDLAPPVEGVDCEFKATFEVYPDVEIGGIEEIQISRPVGEVSDDDIERMLQTLRKQRRIWSPVERVSQDGDRLSIDFVGKIDGEVFAGGSSENFLVELGAGMTIPGFDANLLGLSGGEEKTFEATFPDDYGNGALAGKTAEFQVKVTEVAESELPAMDEAFVKSFGVESGEIDALKDQLKDNMSRELDQSIRTNIKDQVMEGILGRNEVAVPKALIDQEIRNLLQQSGANLPEDSELTITDPMREEYGDEARRRVALGLLVGEVIKGNEITADDERVKQHLETLAASYEHPEQVRTWYRQNPHALDGVRAMTLEEQVVDWVLQRAQVSDKESTFAEITKPGWEQENTRS